MGSSLIESPSKPFFNVMSSLPLTKQNLKFLSKSLNAFHAGAQTPRLNRSRSQSPKSVGKKRVRYPSSAKPGRKFGALLKTNMMANLHPLVQTKISSEKKLALAKSGYFDAKDVKNDVSSLQTQNDQLVKEIQLAVGAIRAGLKDRPIRMKISAPFVITTTVTSGVTRTVVLAGNNNQLNPSYTNEWSTVSALFEEYKCLGGHCVFNYQNPASAPASPPVASITPDSIPVMAYDPSDGSNAPSSTALTEFSQHKTFPSSIVYGGTGAVHTQHHTFRWHVPRGTADQGTGVVVAGTEWIVVAGVTNCGYLKFYHLGTSVVAINNGAGFVYFDCEFRCRT